MIDARGQPFTAPMVTPFTKYFCRKGYSRIMGPVATTVMASFMGSLGTSLAGMPLLAAAAFMAWALVRILFRKYCSGYISRLIVPQDAAHN